MEIVPREPTKVIKVGSTLLASKKMNITTFLKENQVVFAWTHEDMLGIDREIIQHHLNVNLEYKSV